MQKSKEAFRAEIIADFKGNYEGMGLILFLNRIVKNMHTRYCIFFATSIIPYTVGFCLWYFYQKPMLLCIFAGMTSHLVTYFLFIYFSKDLDETYNYFKDYEEILMELKMNRGRRK